jgi:hypothetical protein
MQYLILAIDNAPDSSPVGHSFSTNKPLNHLNLAESHFKMLSGVCMEFCIVTRWLDLLFDPIFCCFYEAWFINVFLDVMDVLHDKLKYIAPEGMVIYVAHCKDMKDLSMVEWCLLHMQWKAQVIPPEIRVNLGTLDWQLWQVGRDVKLNYHILGPGGPGFGAPFLSCLDYPSAVMVL